MLESRDGTRRYFFDVYRMMQDGSPLEGMARLVAEVIAWHPGYHDTLRDVPQLIERDFGRDEPEHNPFLHMGLHIALREQVEANRPGGIAQLHQSLLARASDPHEAEHSMIECLATELWRAQSADRLPDEQAYLTALQALAAR